MSIEEFFSKDFDRAEKKKKNILQLIVKKNVDNDFKLTANKKISSLNLGTE